MAPERRCLADLIGRFLHQITQEAIGAHPGRLDFGRVSLAARLEEHTKIMGQPILINDITRLGLSDDIPVEDLGIKSIRGKKEQVHVYSVLVG